MSDCVLRRRRTAFIGSVFLALATLLRCSGDVNAQDHHHHGDEEEVERPKVYLDKSTRIVEYQLKRLSNSKLLLVETAHDHPKYLPVFKAILLRPGMARKNRDEALAGLAAIKKTDIGTELLAALNSLNDESREDQRVGRQLSAMLLSLPKETLTKHAKVLQDATSAKNSILQATGFAGLIVAGKSDEAAQASRRNDISRVAWLSAVSLVPRGKLRDSLRPAVVEMLNAKQNDAVRSKAIQVLAGIDENQGSSFQLLADFVPQSEFRTVAVRSLLKIPDDQRGPAISQKLVTILVDHAESTPAAERTSDEFLDAMQLADELLRKLSPEKSKEYRDRLRAVTVRVVRLHTVEEEMRYDKPYFAVESGRPVQVVLVNDDLMPHNLVITRTDKLKDVALAGAALGTTPGLDGKLYVPESPDVLFSTDMVNAGQRAVLTFDAPTEPGEYPYVCTFPRHWLRMYGVMKVVPDLDAWQRNPVEPKDPLGNTRSFVKKWTLTDFPRSGLEKALQGRSRLIGEKLFKDATCLSCHQIKGQGGKVGPELSEVMKRWKGDKHGILREIIEPSYKIDPKYAVRIVIDIDGRTTSGIVTAEDKDSISMLSNPEAPKPKVIKKDDIEEIIPSTTSMMPKALLDKFSQDEIMEILNYITSSQ